MEKLVIPSGQEFNIFSSRFPSWKNWLATMVLDIDGNHTGEDGTSKSVSNDLDLQLLLALRSRSNVIVTTGKTARTEGYKSSRFAPIAILTRRAETLKNIPALDQVGAFENLVLRSETEHINFAEVQENLKSRGFNTFLFEGGPASLSELLSSKLEIQFVLSVIGGGDLDLKYIRQIALERVGLTDEFSLEDDFLAGENRVLRLVKPAI